MFMNSARLARKWTEARGDYGRTAEALGEKIDDYARLPGQALR
jgi:hypothetical protein